MERTCEGYSQGTSSQLELSTAQWDIAADWITAYKKCLHTDRPLSEDSDVAPFMDKRYGLLGSKRRTLDHFVIKSNARKGGNGSVSGYGIVMQSLAD